MPGVTLHLHLAERALLRWRRRGGAPFPAGDPEIAGAFRLGSFGPDLGYFPSGPTALSDLAHAHRTADLCRALLAGDPYAAKPALTRAEALQPGDAATRLMLHCAQSWDQGYTLQEVILRIVSDLEIPVAYGLRSGHVTRKNITIPIGVRASLSVNRGQVTLKILDLSRVSPGLRLLFPTGMQIANLIIPVTGKHPTDLNSATGDPLPGRDVHFQLNYTIGWKSRNGNIAGFIRFQPDNKGGITCN